MSVQGNDTQRVAFNFKELTCHELIVFIGRNGKKRLGNDLPECELRDFDRLVAFDDRKIGKIIPCLTGDHNF